MPFLFFVTPPNHFCRNEFNLSVYNILVTGGFSRVAASNYLRKAGETHGTVSIDISVGKHTKYMQVIFHFTDLNIIIFCIYSSKIFSL